MGHGAMETERFHDYGNAFRYENVECGSCDLEHRQSYMKYQGKYVHFDFHHSRWALLYELHIWHLIIQPKLKTRLHRLLLKLIL